MSERTFIVRDPHMQGKDVEAWQEVLNRQMRTWDVDYAIDVDGDYGTLTRGLTASVCHGLGLSSASEAMQHGVTPELRIKLRNKDLTDAERERYHDRAEWREGFRRRHEHKDIARPLIKIISSDGGWSPGHDGVDLICADKAPLFAICRSEVIRADPGGWWGKNAPSDPAVLAKGDGIIVLRSLTDVGPFKQGLNFCYGHAEGATVKVGDKVDAGTIIGHAGFARASHIHFMVNARTDAKGLGDRDPMPYVRYAFANA